MAKKGKARKAAEAGAAREDRKRRKKRLQWILAGVIVLGILIALGVLLASLQEQRDAQQDVLLATVNGDPIYRSEIQTQYARLPAELQQQLSEEAILEQTIDQRLVLQEAEREGIVVTSDDVNAQIQQQASGFGISVDQLRQLLRSSNVTWEEYQAAVREEMTINRFVQERIISGVRVDSATVEQYYERNEDAFTTAPGELRVSHILVETEAEAGDLRERALAGEDFAELAREHSIGPSAPRGGSLGTISQESALVEPFKSVALNLSVGEVSQPVQTEFGWHVITRDPDTMPLSDVRERIEQQLVQEETRERFEDLIESLRDEAEIRMFTGAESLS